MFVLGNANAFNTLFRQFFFNIDRVVFNFISTIYDFLISIARTSILSQADIMDVAGRIYKLLAIFMVFKVTFSLITYVVNPDDFSDKSKGIGKLILNIIFSLALLILTPYAFNIAYQVQTRILEDNSLSALVFGNKANDSNSSVFNTAGDKMAYIALSPFFTPDLTFPDASNSNGTYVCADLTTTTDEIDGQKRVFNDKCRAALANLKLDDTVLSNYVAGVEYSNLGLMFREDLVKASAKNSRTNTDEYVMEYKLLFSTAVGIIIVLVLITFCMDVALRSIKLAFYQLIAPIPIISYIDPKSGKDGMFKKWYQACFKTYISLFVRLLALYFAVYIISRIDNMVDIVDGSYVTNSLIKVVIVIGALMFAKQLPKILEGLGIKLDGDGKFFLNPIKKFEEQTLGGKKILGFGAAGAAAGLAGAVNLGSRAFNKDTWKNKDGKFTLGSAFKGIGKTLGSGIAGTTSATYRGIRKTAKGEKAGKIFTDSYGEAMFAKIQREDLERKGSTFWGRRAADIGRLTGNLNAGQRQILTAGEQDNAVAAMEYEINSGKVKLEKMKKEKLQPLKKLQDVSKKVDSLLEADGAVKGAKAVWDAAKAEGNPEKAEAARQAYKVVKANRLSEIYNNSGEGAHVALSQAVDLHNKMQGELNGTAEYTGKTRAISTGTVEFVSVPSGTGAWKFNGTSYEYVGTGGDYNLNKSTSGVEDMGSNDDSVRYEETILETTEDYRNIADSVEQVQKDLEAFKTSEEYIRAHDKNSGALADNAAVHTTAPQKEGWTPNPEHADAITYAQGSYGRNTSSFVNGTNPSVGPGRGSGRPRGSGR